MPIAINGSGTLTGVSVGGLPDGIVDADTLATDAVTTVKIEDDAVTDAKQDLTGVAKAWIVFDGTSSSIGTGAASYNVSGVTDHGTGDFTITFSSAFPNTNYGYVITGNHPTSGGQGFTYSYQSHADNVPGNSRHSTTSLRIWIGWVGFQANPTIRHDLNPTTVVIYGA